MKGITPEIEYDRQIQERWHEYLNTLGKCGSEVSQAFIRVHSLVEQNHFMLPKLQNGFMRYRDEYQKLFNSHLELVGYMYQLNSQELIKESKEKEVQAAMDKVGTLEQCADLIAYSMDFFGLLQHQMIGNVFKFKHKERKPRIGKILTKKGWKEAGK